MRYMKILVVDDDLNILRLLKRALTPRGFEVITAQNAREGFDLALQAQPEILITDFEMPGESGLELIMRLQRSGCKSSQLRCLLMSGSEKTYIQQSCWNAQPALLEHIFFKPFSISDLFEHIGKAVSQIKNVTVSTNSCCPHRSHRNCQDVAATNFEEFAPASLNEATPDQTRLGSYSPPYFNK